MEGEGNGNGKKGSISIYRTPTGKPGLDISSSIPISEVKVTDPEHGTRTYHSGGDSLEVSVDKTFKMISKGRYQSKLLPEKTKYQNPDSLKIYSALDFLIGELKPKVVTFQFHTGSMSNVEGRIEKIRDKDSYRTLTAQEHKEFSDFLTPNVELSIDPRNDDAVKLPNRKYDVFGGVTGESIIFPIHFEDLDKEGGVVEGKVAYVRLFGVPNLDETKMQFIKAWEDNADFMLYQILDMNKEINEGVEKRFKEKEEQDKPFELVDKGEGKASGMNRKQGINIPGIGFQDGSPFCIDALAISSNYDMIVGIEGARDPTFTNSFNMPLPSEVYREDKLTAAISEFAAKLTLAVADDAIKAILQKAKNNKRIVEWGDFSRDQYIDAAVFNALYVLSPKYAKDSKTGEPLYTQLQKEKDIDRISNFFSGMIHKKFEKLTGKDGETGRLMETIAQNMDSNAESIKNAKSNVNMLVYMTNVVEACRHYSNYVMESDLTDSLDPSADAAHTAFDGIMYLGKVGYGSYSDMIARKVLSPEEYIVFQETVMEEKQRTQPQQNGSGKKPSVKGVEERVRPGAVQGGDSEANKGYTSGPWKPRQ